jgi:signal transduction histidine kinase
VGTFTALSVVFNAMHVYEQGAMARGVAMLPPIVAFISFELLMLMVRRTIERLAKIESRDAAAAQLATMEAEKARLDDDAAALRDTIAQLQSRAVTAQSQSGTYKERAVAIIAASGADMTPAALADELGCSESHARGILSEYRGNGR